MPGPTPWQQNFTVYNFGTQSITTTAETVIATLAGVNSRSAGATINLLGYAQFAVQAATTSTTLRVRVGSLTGTVVSSTTGVFAATAASTSQDQLAVAAQDTPSGEYAGQTYVLTIAAAAAGANWNVTAASLIALV